MDRQVRYCWRLAFAVDMTEDDDRSIVLAIRAIRKKLNSLPDDQLSILLQSCGKINVTDEPSFETSNSKATAWLQAAEVAKGLCRCDDLYIKAKQIDPNCQACFIAGLLVDKSLAARNK